VRRLPLVPTIVVAGAVAVMIALGIWQLQRAAWKERLLAEYAATLHLPPVDLDPLLDGDHDLSRFSFRRALVSCHVREAAPELRAGRSLGDEVGQVYTIPCRPAAGGTAGRIRVNVGWSPDIRREIRPSLDGIVAGRLSAVADDGPIVLVAATPAPGLLPARPTSFESVPNNHLIYAGQWFFFAAAAAVIYLLALRRRGTRELPPEP
jgi:surfeit locus 1 family protein